jgi:type IV secretion system protein VirB8
MSTLKFLSMFKKSDTKSKSGLDVQNWYQDKYDSIRSQRNILVFGMFSGCIIVVLSLVMVVTVANSKKYEPFVVQVEKKTGLAKVLKPSVSDKISSSESINRYFIKKYLIAKETYNKVSLDRAKKVVQLLSTSQIYRLHLQYIRREENNPTILYGDETATYLKIRSWSRVNENQYLVRFSIKEFGRRQGDFNKIALVEINYVDMETSEENLDINPIGFQVTGYRVDEDNS